MNQKAFECITSATGTDCYTYPEDLISSHDLLFLIFVSALVIIFALGTIVMLKLWK